MKNLIIFFVFGTIYINIEVFFKALKYFDAFGFAFIGYTSMWMFFVGGISSLFVGLINENIKIPIILECIIGGLIITIIEFTTGMIFNVWLGFELWDYTDMPLNIEGQVCLLFSIVWCGMVPCIHRMDDILRRELK